MKTRAAQRIGVLLVLSAFVLTEPLFRGPHPRAAVESHEFCRLIGLPFDSNTRVDWNGRPGGGQLSENVQVSTFAVTYNGFMELADFVDGVYRKT